MTFLNVSSSASSKQGADKSYFLLPMKKIIFTWAPRIVTTGACEDDDDEMDNRFLVWECGKTRVTDKLMQDRCGEAEVGTGPTSRLFWVSFVHRSQRILLFTRNVELASAAQVSSSKYRVYSLKSQHSYKPSKASIFIL